MPIMPTDYGRASSDKTSFPAQETNRSTQIISKGPAFFKDFSSQNQKCQGESGMFNMQSDCGVLRR